MNRVILVGHLTHDPELRYTPQGRPVARIRLATNEYAGQDDAGAAREHAEFHFVAVWGASAEAAAKHLAKGRQVLIEGALRTRSWEAEDATRHYRTEVLASRVEFLGGASARATDTATTALAATAAAVPDLDPSDVRPIVAVAPVSPGGSNEVDIEDIRF